MMRSKSSSKDGSRCDPMGRRRRSNTEEGRRSTIYKMGRVGVQWVLTGDFGLDCPCLVLQT